jgi:drug/metabolite transporter (DMT)-like permease
MPDTLDYKEPATAIHRRWNMLAVLGLFMCLFWFLPGGIIIHLIEAYDADANFSEVAAFAFLLAGIACCILGLKQIARHPRQYRGRSVAIAGLVVGFAWVAFYLTILLGIIRP